MTPTRPAVTLQTLLHRSPYRPLPSFHPIRDTHHPNARPKHDLAERGRRLSWPQDTGQGITALNTDNADAKTHVIVLVNGLFGTAENWTVVVEKLRERLGEAALRSTLIMASMASSRTETYDGIDRCARLFQSYVQLTRLLKIPCS